jgi:putative transposase
LSTSQKRLLVAAEAEVSIHRQCELLGLARSSYYYQPAAESPYNLELMRLIDEQYLDTSYYGVGMMHDHLVKLGHRINIKRVRRLYRIMNLVGLVPQPSTSTPARSAEHVIYPYLLRGIDITHSNQVWSTDITYVPMPSGYFYLTAVIDCYSRFVLSWAISNSLENSFCIAALSQALEQYGSPEIFNTDQGSQFTARNFLDVLRQHQIAISMDGRGRALDNVFIERLWRSYKYEYLYLNCPDSGPALHQGTEQYFGYFNHQRPHSSLAGQSPVRIYLGQK